MGEQPVRSPGATAPVEADDTMVTDAVTDAVADGTEQPEVQVEVQLEASDEPPVEAQDSGEVHEATGAPEPVEAPDDESVPRVTGEVPVQAAAEASRTQRLPALRSIADTIAPRPARRLAVPFQGRIVDVVTDEVDLGSAGVVRREFVSHPGAVAVVALDDQDRVLLVRQYRHPVGAVLWELPAGLLDVDGEDPHVAAGRELAEEADVVAATWDVLTDLLPTPGGSNEAIRVYLARDLTPVPDEERHLREAEEAEMVVVPVPLQDAVQLVLAGKLHNAAAVAGILAAAIGHASSWTTLRPADAHWGFRRR